MDAYVIKYEFHFDDGRCDPFVLRLDPATMRVVDPLPADPPEWTLLERERCPVCTLPAPERHCPAAAHLAPVVATFAEVACFAEGHIRVTLPERVVQKFTRVQAGLGSLIGLYMSTSGCPVLARLRPMARFHLPFASAYETSCRAASMYLMAQWLRALDGKRPEWRMIGLAEIYRHTSEVNKAFARRLRRFGDENPRVNIDALVGLDMFAKTMTASIADGLQDLRSVFAPLLAD